MGIITAQKCHIHGEYATFYNGECCSCLREENICLRAFRAEVEALKPKECVWAKIDEFEDSGGYSSECGNEYYFCDASLEEEMAAGMGFCPYCGGEVVAGPLPEPEEK